MPAPVTPPHDNKQILIFPDYTRKVQDLWKNFLPIKRLLHEDKIKYGLLYLVKLGIQHKDTVHFFETAAAATEWLDHQREGNGKQTGDLTGRSSTGGDCNDLGDTRLSKANFLLGNDRTVEAASWSVRIERSAMRQQ
ncbi:hypothetical protein NDU88_003501 [Pleurodeles waltl]|uniref:Uncharacterized protein n=1 Tax=Pleurodeles waltl TaxID=8319 RepID=A0AAV7W6F0_PLEWA|nr:hypothetical protein NDU88_003501 [Pleurodeles waltl]